MTETYEHSWSWRLSGFASEWKEAWERPEIRAQVIIVATVSVFYAWVIPGFLRYIQHRQGIILADPLLRVLPTVDISLYCFSLLYLSVISTLIYLSTRPERFLLGFMAYALVVGMRLITIYLIPLDPPTHIIPLIDPFIDRFFYVDMTVTKDLFFSGHVSTVFMLYLVVDHPRLRRFLLSASVLIAVMLLVQHVHYTLDILAAPFFTWMAYRLGKAIQSGLKDFFGRRVPAGRQPAQ